MEKKWYEGQKRSFNGVGSIKMNCMELRLAVFIGLNHAKKNKMGYKAFKQGRHDKNLWLNEF